MGPKDDLLQHLNDLLDSGRFPNQSRLPPERELADELGTTRTNLRSALAVLEAEGKIWRHVGRGTFVGRPAPTNEPGLNLLLEATNPTEIMEARLIIEPRVAGLAALRATAGDIAHLRRCLEKGIASVTDIKTYELWDATLHEAIAEASHSVLLNALLKALSGLRESDALWGRLKKASLTRERQYNYNDQHRRCVETIGDRDAEAAEIAMREHLQTVQMDLFGRHSDVR